MQYISLPLNRKSSASYMLDAGRSLRIETYEGKIGLRELRGVALEASADPGWSPGFSSLLDLEWATLDLPSNDVLRVALTWRKTGCRSGGWTAFVVGPTTSIGVVRMLGAWARISETMEIFTDRLAAERWLARRRVLQLAKAG